MQGQLAERITRALDAMARRDSAMLDQLVAPSAEHVSAAGERSHGRDEVVWVLRDRVQGATVVVLDETGAQAIAELRLESPVYLLVSAVDGLIRRIEEFDSAERAIEAMVRE